MSDLKKAARKKLRNKLKNLFLDKEMPEEMAKITIVTDEPSKIPEALEKAKELIKGVPLSRKLIEDYEKNPPKSKKIKRK